MMAREYTLGVIDRSQCRCYVDVGWSTGAARYKTGQVVLNSPSFVRRVTLRLHLMSTTGLLLLEIS